MTYTRVMRYVLPMPPLTDLNDLTVRVDPTDDALILTWPCPEGGRSAAIITPHDSMHAPVAALLAAVVGGAR